MKHDLGIAPPDRYLTIYLARCPADAVATARAVHGVVFDRDQAAGYSVAGDLSLLAVWDGSDEKGDSAPMRTMRHELFHLVAQADFADMPQWLDEGLAQYYGVKFADPDYGRTTYLAPGWGQSTSSVPVLPPLRAVLDAGWFRFDNPAEAQQNRQHCTSIAAAMMHADVARMFLAYVDRTPGQLASLYGGLRALKPDDWAGLANGQLSVVERIMGAPVERLDTDYRAASLVQYKADLFKQIDDTSQSCPG